MAKIVIELMHPELCLGCPYLNESGIPYAPIEGCDYFQYSFDTDEEWCAYNIQTKEIISSEDWNEHNYDKADEEYIAPTAIRPPMCIEKFGK